MAMKPTFSWALFATSVCAQSIEGWGVSGGDGPRGGIGDEAHPVRRAQSFITDTFIPLDVNSTRHLSEGPPPVLVRRNGPSTFCDPRNVVVDSSPKGARQEMLGFGHAWTDSAVTTFNSLEPDVLAQVMEDLFGQSGNNMGFMRHTIGSSDLSGHQYSYDDNGPSFNLGEPDPTLEHFSLGPHGTAMADMLATMGHYKGDVFLWGAPWSYPGWMKNNALFVAPNLLNGYNILNNSINPAYMPQAVEYFTKYVDAFKARGVTVNGLSLMNEPLNYQGGYPCMLLEPADAAAIINQGLGSAMLERNVKIIAYDHNTDQPGYPGRVIQGAPNFVDAAGWHCYASPSANYSVLNDLHQFAPKTVQFMTECSSFLPGPGQFSSWVAQHFIGPVRNGASGGTFWVMATNPDYGPHSPYGGCAGCLGSIIVNSSTTYTKTHDYYMVGQFSRFVRRGSVNYQILEGYEGDESTPDQFFVMSVKNPDGSWAVIFMNNLSTDQDVVLSFTEHENEFWEGVIPSSAVVTWLIPSQQMLKQPHGTNATATASNSGAPFSFTNSTTILGPGSAPASGTAPGTGSGSTCPPSTTTSSSAAGSSATSSTLLPVPNTTHTIAASAIPTVAPTQC